VFSFVIGWSDRVSTLGLGNNQREVLSHIRRVIISLPVLVNFKVRRAAPVAWPPPVVGPVRG